MSIVANIRAALHVHAWKVTAWNAYNVEAERKCRCGARQHVDLHSDLQQELGAPSVWLPGAHPIAARMRADPLKEPT